MQKQTGTLLAVTLILGSALRAQPAGASKPAEEVYKNIVSLKGTPADQVMPAMQFMASSLGVECTFCHVQGKMEADDKGAKKTAREMIAMQAAINKESFRGQLQVTCFSCHRGAQRPVSGPPVLESDAARPAPPAMAPATPGAPAVTADQIIEKYVTALGGADAIRKINRRVMTGSILANGS
jgi:photosynthetic reaction center cytochrome c subunit